MSCKARAMKNLSKLATQLKEYKWLAPKIEIIANAFFYLPKFLRLSNREIYLHCKIEFQIKIKLKWIAISGLSYFCYCSKDLYFLLFKFQ